eukprot:403347931
MILVNDITQFKLLEKTSKTIRSMFFSSIAHELRTPLNSIIPISEELQKRDWVDGTTKLYLDIIVNSAHHLENVIEDALDMNRLENNKFEINNSMFDVREVAKQVIDIMRLQVEQKDLYIQYQFDDSIPNKILSDKKRFRQVLFNLVGNAIKFTFSGGIKISMRFTENNILQTTVSDTGIGMCSDDLNKLFQFFGKIQAHKNINKSGMGLGLTISKMILSEMGGTISVTSEQGKGTLFIFEIPIEEASNHFSSNFLQTQQFLRHHDEQIQECYYDESNFSTLRNEQIDDSPYNLLVMKELLKTIPNVYETQTALNGQQAIDAILNPNNLLNNRSTFDYIFMDLNMPVMDGIQTVMKMREAEHKGNISFSKTEIIAFSAINQKQFKEMKYNNIFNSFLEKPITLDRLKEILN